jgi:hypothetical protein
MHSSKASSSVCCVSCRGGTGCYIGYSSKSHMQRSCMTPACIGFGSSSAESTHPSAGVARYMLLGQHLRVAAEL